MLHSIGFFFLSTRSLNSLLVPGLALNYDPQWFKCNVNISSSVFLNTVLLFPFLLNNFFLVCFTHSKHLLFSGFINLLGMKCLTKKNCLLRKSLCEIYIYIYKSHKQHTYIYTRTFTCIYIYIESFCSPFVT